MLTLTLHVHVFKLQIEIGLFHTTKNDCEQEYAVSWYEVEINI